MPWDYTDHLPLIAKDESSAGSGASVTIAAPGAGKRIVITDIWWGYDVPTASTDSSIIVQYGGTTYFDHNFTVADGANNQGHIELNFRREATNEEVIVTTGDVTGSVASVNVRYYIQ